MVEMLTYTRKTFDPASPKPEQISIIDIAHALSHQARFCGQIKDFYTVASHSVMVSKILEYFGADARRQMYGLLHDAHEAYISDIPSPVKELLGPEIEHIEANIDKAIYLSVGIAPLSQAEKAVIKTADIIAFYAEDRALRGNLKLDIEHQDVVTSFWKKVKVVSMEQANLDFLERYHKLKEQIS